VIESEEDRRWMEHALALAAQSTGLAAPNPAVGCVLTQGGSPVGEGSHRYDLLDHAEVIALRAAGDRARGATAYVTLEPCSHQGRTGPCADALLAAGVARVVVATSDPNPAVLGQGIAKLRAAGVAVTTGVLEERARRLNDAFAKFIRTGLPFVTMKVAASLDGRIAQAPVGSSVDPAAPRHWISGEEARAEVQRMRHAADALLVGVGTVLADDPWLTDRSNLPRRRPLLRVVLDPTLRTPPSAKIVATAHQGLLIVYTRGSAEAEQALAERGVQLQRISSPGGEGAGGEKRAPLNLLMKSLAGRAITSLLVEAGSAVNAAFLQQDLVDRLVLFYAPIFLGPDAVPMLSSLPQARKIESFMLHRFGQDFAFEGDLHNPWAGVV
jgi:diaminohydroxyphosphoribosylaminopyrimidine deaminase/5-amino-6-(5-phosphoribosylamino)uracil reductase